MRWIFSLLVPGTPTNFSVTYINSTALVLTWQPPPPEQRNGVITRYVINITGLSEARQEPYVLYTTKTNVVVGSLHPSYTYTCKVAAETNVGPGPFSITVAQLPEDSMFHTTYVYLGSVLTTNREGYSYQ